MADSQQQLPAQRSRQTQQEQHQSARRLTTTRKRARRGDDRGEKLEQYGIDLPEIPGLPVAIIPLHVYALKQTLASIKYDAKRTTLPPPSTTNDNEEEDDDDGLVPQDARTRLITGQTNQPGDSLVSRLVNRVEQAGAAVPAASSIAEDIARKQEIRMRHRQRKESIDAWLGAIHREIRNDQTSKRKKESESGASTRTSIPVAALEHFWSAAIEHRRIHVRRAALHVSGCLLQKSADARRWLLEDTQNLAKWMDVISEAEQHSQSSNYIINNNHTNDDDDEEATLDLASLQRRLWQREGYAWLKELLDRGYGTLYPRLQVAVQRMEQDSPWVLDSDKDLVEAAQRQVQNMETWRSWRDLALHHYKEEERRVNRILKYYSKCMDVVFPRVGQDDTAQHQHEQQKPTTGVVSASREDNGDRQETGALAAGTTASTEDTNAFADDADDDEDDIDWEDGWEDEATKNGDQKDKQNNNDVDSQQQRQAAEFLSHHDSVERTLAAIQATAPVENGQLVIDMNGRPNEVVPSEMGSANGYPASCSPLAMERARKRLAKCVQLLQNRHVPRSSQWIDGITKADCLCTDAKTAALVQMDDNAKHKRKLALATLMELKAVMTRTLSAAQRLELPQQPQESLTTTTTKARSSTTTSQPCTTTRGRPAASPVHGSEGPSRMMGNRAVASGRSSSTRRTKRTSARPLTIRYNNYP